MAKIQNTKSSCFGQIPNTDKTIEHQEFSFIVGGNAKWHSHFRRQFGIFLQKINMLLTHNSAITFLGIFSDVMKTYIHIKTCMWILIATLFIIAKTWKQPRCPSIGEWVNKSWHIHIMKYFPVIKKNEPSSHEKTQRKLKHILSERTQSEKAPYCMVPITWHPGKGKTVDRVKKKKKKKIRGWEGGKERWIGGAQGIFRGGKPCRIILQWWIHLTMPFVKTHRVHSTKRTSVNNHVSVLAH